MTQPQAEPPEDLSAYSDAPFTADDWRRLRRTLLLVNALNEERRRLKPMIASYEAAGKIGKGAMRALAWAVGAIVTVVGLLNGLKAINWWPFNQGGP